MTEQRDLEYSKMAETSPISEQTIETKPETIEKEPTKIENEAVVQEPEPKRKGRPQGAKDKKPRKKTVKIVEEPIAAHEPAEASQPVVKPPEPQLEQRHEHEPQRYEPASPKTIMRFHRDALFHAQRLEQADRRRRTQESILNRLHAWPA